MLQEVKICPQEQVRRAYERMEAARSAVEMGGHAGWLRTARVASSIGTGIV